MNKFPPVWKFLNAKRRNYSVSQFVLFLAEKIVFKLTSVGFHAYVMICCRDPRESRSLNGIDTTAKQKAPNQNVSGLCSNDFIDHPHVSLSCRFFRKKRSWPWETLRLGKSYSVKYRNWEHILKNTFRANYTDAGCWTFVGIVSTYGAQHLGFLLLEKLP